MVSGYSLLGVQRIVFHGAKLPSLVLVVYQCLARVFCSDGAQR